MLFLEWNLLASNKHCSNKVVPWRFEDETLIECFAFCGGEGHLALTYREDNGNCACCNNPPSLEDNTAATVYTLPGQGAFIRFLNVL